MGENSNEILHDFSPLMKVYKNGKIERPVDEEKIPPSFDSDTNVLSKDVVIDPNNNLSARLYLPNAATTDGTGKLPLLLFFHGGAFIVSSTFSPTYHKHLYTLTSETQVLVVSLEYRRSPENPLPTAFYDAWQALEWVGSPESTDEWITRHADLSRVFLGGDSAGATIAHNVALKNGEEKLKGITLVGIFMNCPFFYGEKPMGNEEDPNVLFSKRFICALWPYICPGTVGVDDPLINPAKDPKVGGLGCKKVLVYVGEKDVFRERGWYYKEVLEKSGWDGVIEVVEVKGEDHVFSVVDSTSENAKSMFAKVASFLNA